MGTGRDADLLLSGEPCVGGMLRARPLGDIGIGGGKRPEVGSVPSAVAASAPAPVCIGCIRCIRGV